MTLEEFEDNEERWQLHLLKKRIEDDASRGIVDDPVSAELLKEQWANVKRKLLERQKEHFEKEGV